MATYFNAETGQTWDSETGEITEGKSKASPPPFEFSAAQMAKNTPGSAYQLGKDLYGAVTNPIDTAKGVGGLLRGGMSKAFNWDDPAERSLEAAGDLYKERYGGTENILQTLQNDPVGLLSDITGALGVAGKVAKIPKLTAAANALEPINLATKGVSKLVPSAEGLYQSAAKFTTTTKRPQSEVAANIRTGLDEGISPTSKGLLKLDTLVDKIRGQIDTAIDASVDADGWLDRDVLYKHINKLKKKSGGIKAEGAADIKIIDGYLKEMDDHFESIGASRLNARQLQDFKTDLYKKIDFDRTQQKSVPAMEATRKKLAKAAKEGVEELTSDEVTELNARQGRLLSLRKQLEPAASRVERRDMIGLGLPVKALLGTAAGGPIGGGLGAAIGLLDTPKVKAALAQMINRGGRLGIPDKISATTLPRQGLLEIEQLLEAERRRQAQQYPSVFNR